VGCSNHHGYALEKDRLQITCGADEGTRGDSFHVDLNTGVVSHQLNGDIVKVSSEAIKMIRNHQASFPMFDRMIVERCDDNCSYSGCDREVSEGGEIQVLWPASTVVQCEMSSVKDGVLSLEETPSKCKPFRLPTPVEEETTGEGNPVMGDALRCKGCGTKHGKHSGLF
jgi:hypothetical protein